MKKTFWLSLVTIIVSFNEVHGACYYSSYSEPLSEVYFENGKWYVEISACCSGIDFSEYDSIVMKSNSGVSKLKDTIFKNPSKKIGFAVITEDSLSSPLTLNNTSDNLTVTFYRNGNKSGYSYGVSWGDASTDNVMAPLAGQSIVLNGEYCTTQVYISGTPTLGEKNDLNSGITMQGYLYDMNGNVIRNYYISLNSTGTNYLKTDENGYFSVKVRLQKIGLTCIYLCVMYCSSFKCISINPIEYDRNVTTLYKDIRLLGPLSVEEETTDEVIECYPVPAKEILNVRVGKQINQKNAGINLIDQKGNAVYTGKLSGKTEYIIPVGSLAPGIYTVLISSETNNISSKQVVIE